MKKNEEIFEVTDDAFFAEEPHSKIKSIAFPFVFPDGTNGVATVTYISRRPWIPKEHFSQLIIKFHDDTNQ